MVTLHETLEKAQWKTTTKTPLLSSEVPHLKTQGSQRAGGYTRELCDCVIIQGIQFSLTNIYWEFSVCQICPINWAYVLFRLFEVENTPKVYLSYYYFLNSLL